MNFFEAIWNWILSLFGQGTLKAIEIDNSMFMPLFVIIDGKVKGTWDYLAWTVTEQKQCRDQIKSGCVNDEIPAITILAQVDGDYGKERITELVEDGIAVFICLYIDDPGGSQRRWWEIESHTELWKTMNDEIGDLVSGYILSIESTEKGDYRRVENAINVMKDCCSGAQFYGTHLQWGTRWSSSSNTPSNADIILVETTWHPANGASVKIEKFREEIYDIMAAAGTSRLVIHEYAFNPTAEQRAWLREQKLLGIG